MTSEATGKEPAGPTLGVILLDIDGYVGIEKAGTPKDSTGLGKLPPGFFENPGTWNCQTLYRVAKGCTPEAISHASDEAARGLHEAAHALEGRVNLITSDCAYTWFLRQALGDIEAPLCTSSLSLLEVARALGPNVAVVASSSYVLGRLLGNTSLPGVRVVGLESKFEWGRYQVATVGMTPPLDKLRMGEELMRRLEEDFADHGVPDVVLLECTGLPQFRPLVRRLFSGPVLDVASFVCHLLDIPPIRSVDSATLPAP